MRRIAALSLVLLSLAAACAKGPAASSDSGIEGIVLLGPMCPVEMQDSPCPDKPLSAEIEVMRGGDLVTTMTSGEDGRFSVAVPPGEYVLKPVSPNPNGLPVGRPLSVAVKAHEFTDVTVMFDSGIR